MSQHDIQTAGWYEVQNQINSINAAMRNALLNASNVNPRDNSILIAKLQRDMTPWLQRKDDLYYEYEFLYGPPTHEDIERLTNTPPENVREQPDESKQEKENALQFNHALFMITKQIL